MPLIFGTLGHLHGNGRALRAVPTTGENFHRKCNQTWRHPQRELSEARAGMCFRGAVSVCVPHDAKERNRSFILKIKSDSKERKDCGVHCLNRTGTPLQPPAPQRSRLSPARICGAFILQTL